MNVRATPLQSSGGVWKSRWPSWAPVPNKPTVSVDVKQHSTRLPQSTFWRLNSYAALRTKLQSVERENQKLKSDVGEQKKAIAALQTKMDIIMPCDL